MHAFAVVESRRWVSCAQFLRLGFAGYTKIMKNMHGVSLYLAKAISAIGATPRSPYFHDSRTVVNTFGC